MKVVKFIKALAYKRMVDRVIIDKWQGTALAIGSISLNRIRAYETHHGFAYHIGLGTIAIGV
jgi:hypothetical protein